MEDTELQEIETYSLVVKQALEVIMHDNSMSKDDKLDIIYATPSIAFAKYKEKIVNGEKPGPLVTFYLSSMELKRGEQMGGYMFLNVSTGYRMRAPQIYSLKYTVTINCIKESQGDLLQTQILLGMPFNHPYAVKSNSQWVTMTTEDPQNLSSVDAGENKDKISRRQLVITIDRAYLDYDFKSIPSLDDINKKIIVRLSSIDGGTQ